MRLLTAGWVICSCSAASEKDCCSATARKAFKDSVSMPNCICILIWNANNEKYEFVLFDVPA